MAKLSELARDLGALTEKIDDFRIYRDSLAFCKEVYLRFAAGEPPTEFMNEEKALQQLLESIERILKV